MPVFLRQSTAVDVALGPFLDSSDGVTAETALTISQADVRLKKNAGAWAQVNDATAATHEENGWYEKELDATDTDTVGRLLIAVHESGALPVWHEFWVLEEAIYDALFAASAAAFNASQRVDVGSVAGTAQTARDLGAQLDAAVSSRLAPTTAGRTLTVDVNGRVDLAAVLGAAINALIAGRLDVNAQVVGDKSGYALGVGGIDATAFAAAAIDAAALAQDAAREIADEILNRDLAGGASGGSRNVRNALRTLRNRHAVAGGTLTVYQEDDSTAAWTAAVTTAAGDPISEVDPT